MKKVILLFTLLAIYSFAISQDTITLVDATIEIKGNKSESFYFGFTQGDRIILHVEELNGKEIGEVSISKTPETIIFKGNGESKQDKTIFVLEENIYEFLITNSSTFKRKKVKVLIQRVPSSPETVFFNTAWEWKTFYDTTFQYYTEDSLVGHDTIYYTENIKEIKSTKKDERILVDRVETVKAIGLLEDNNPRASIEIVMPSLKNNDLHTEVIEAWGYWIAVGKTANSVWNNIIKAGAVAGAAYTGGITSILLGGVSNIELPATEERVKYSVTDQKNSVLFLAGSPYNFIKNGYGSGGYGIIDGANLSKNRYYINLFNENQIKKINVTVKASVVISITDYEYVTHTRQTIKPKYTKINKKRMSITEKKIRVNSK